MARHSPFGFFFGIVLEIAAVAFVVSFLPRIDLRPAAASAPAAPTTAMAPRATSYYEPAAPPRNDIPLLESLKKLAPADLPAARRPSLVSESSSSRENFREPPPLLIADPARPGYVEQRLDRSSQQLVNSVGSYVAQAAGKVFSETPSPAARATSFSISPSEIPSPATGFTPLPALPPAASSQPPADAQYLPNQNGAAPSFAVPAPRRSPIGGSFPTQSQPRPWIRY